MSSIILPGRKSVVVLSGGLDSTTLLYLAYRQGQDILAISFDYGQRHKRELVYAVRSADKVSARHRIVDISSINKLLKGSALSDKSVPVPYGHYAEETMKVTVVPNRNSILLSIAYGWAVAENADNVVSAQHAGDHFIYPDCRPAFLEAFGEAERLGNLGFGNSELSFQAPFSDWTKAEIVYLGSQLRVPYEDTYSCYEGREVHCGRCGTCVERREAFILAEVTDPTEYEATYEEFVATLGHDPKEKVTS